MTGGGLRHHATDLLVGDLDPGPDLGLVPQPVGAVTVDRVRAVHADPTLHIATHHNPKFETKTIELHLSLAHWQYCFSDYSQ